MRSSKLLEEAGKRPRGTPTRREGHACPRFELNARCNEYDMYMHMIIQIQMLQHTLKHNWVSILLDSGASCSVINKEHSPIQPIKGTQLVNADGRTTSPFGTVIIPVTLGNLHVEQMFIILDNLSTPFIPGCDFLTKHNLIMDFSQQTVYHADDPSFMLNMPVKKLNP